MAIGKRPRPATRAVIKLARAVPTHRAELFPVARSGPRHLPHVTSEPSVSRPPDKKIARGPPARANGTIDKEFRFRGCADLLRRFRLFLLETLTGNTLLADWGRGPLTELRTICGGSPETNLLHADFDLRKAQICRNRCQFLIYVRLGWGVRRCSSAVFRPSGMWLKSGGNWHPLLTCPIRKWV
jgi:hypothetical protein